MFIPFVTRTSSKSRYLERRKGGGGGGRSSSSGHTSTGESGGTSTSPSGGKTSSGGAGSTSTGSKPSSGTGKSTGSNSSGAPSTGKTTTVPLSTSTANGKTSAIAYGSGGGRTITIPTNEPFAGRSAGGGIRSQIFGTRTYGSGYPGITGWGVVGRGFPFWYWPIIWSSVPSGSYLQAPEYGNPSNTSRVGGPIAEATFISNSSNTTFHLLSDNSTVASLITSIDANCSSSLSSLSSTSPEPYNTSVSVPQPQQAIQYYRASSVVLTLDGYNNSATLSSNPDTTDTPLPSGIDTALLACLNQTIGNSVPLVSSAGTRWSVTPSGPSLFWLVLVVWCITSL